MRGSVTLQTSRGFTRGLNITTGAAAALLVAFLEAVAAAAAGLGDTLMRNCVIAKLPETLGWRMVRMARKSSRTVGCSWKS
jgi:hypothetical protein